MGFLGEEPPYPLLTIPGLYPLLSRNLESQITIGVLPVPPTTIFPTTITGTLGFQDKLGWFKNLSRLLFTANFVKSERGQRSQSHNFF